MDCRRPAVLLLALAFGAVGCTTSLPVVRISSTRIDPDADEVTHKAPTYVAFGDFRARSAEAPENAPATRDQLRQDAKLAYLKAIEVDPKYLPAYVSLARVQMAGEDHSAAVQLYAKALAMSPSDATLWFELGMCQCRMKDWPSALSNMKKGMDLDPQNRQFATAMGLALARAGQWDEAYTMLARVNGQAKAHYDVARMLKHVNKPADARQHAEAAVAADPRFEAAQRLLVELTQPGTLPPAVANAPPMPQTQQTQQVSYNEPAPATRQPTPMQHDTLQAFTPPPPPPVPTPAPAAPPAAAPAKPVAELPVVNIPQKSVVETPMPTNLPESVDRPIRVPPPPVIRLSTQAG